MSPPDALPADERVYKKRDKQRFVRLSVDGTSCISEPHEAEALLKADPSLEASDVWMTRAAFEALPEFGGW